MNAIVSEKGQITIPKPLRERLGLRKGTLLEVDAVDGKLMLSKREARDGIDEVLRNTQGQDAKRRRVHRRPPRSSWGLRTGNRVTLDPLRNPLVQIIEQHPFTKVKRTRQERTATIDGGHALYEGDECGILVQHEGVDDNAFAAASSRLS